MTTKNLVATIVAAVVLLTGCGVANTQADAKSVTSEATQSVILPSTREADLIRASRSQAREPVKKKTVQKAQKRTPQKPVKKAVAVSRPSAVGIRASAWTGKGYSPRWENVRKCIVKRESEGQYGVINKGSGAMGAYQFMPNWNNGLAYMIGKPKLRNVPINQWSRVDQDHGFWVAWNNGAGAKHWSGGRYNCW